MHGNICRQIMAFHSNTDMHGIPPAAYPSCNYFHCLPCPVWHSQCPTLLAGSFLYTSPYFTKLPLWDRLTALPLLVPLLEVDSSEEAYHHYDQISALELFTKKGVSARLLK